MNDLEYRRKQLQQLKDAVVDLEDMSGGVSITDLTLNDFRMDLSAHMADKANLTALEAAPLGYYAAVTLDATLAADGMKPGVVFCLKNIRSGKDAVHVDDNYPLAPYFLVYMQDDAEQGPAVVLNFTQSKKILDVLKRHATTHQTVDRSAVDRMYKQTHNGRDMSHYQQLLASAIDSIAGKSEEKGVASLFSKGGTVLSANTSQGIEDFMVVAWLVMSEAEHG